jgi:hypothetical protein
MTDSRKVLMLSQAAAILASMPNLPPVFVDFTPRGRVPDPDPPMPTTKRAKAKAARKQRKAKA